MNVERHARTQANDAHMLENVVLLNGSPFHFVIFPLVFRC